MKKLAVLAALVLTGCGGGHVTVHGYVAHVWIAACSIFHPGTSLAPQYRSQLTFRDAGGKIVAVVRASREQYIDKGDPTQPICEIRDLYSVALPKGDFYQVQVADTPGSVTESLKELQASGFALNLFTGLGSGTPTLSKR